MRRGTDPGRRRQRPPFVAVIIGEVFNAAPHPLSPVAPAERLPFALLPLCNTPLIDYVLENLAENGVSEVYILLNAASVAPVFQHLESNRTLTDGEGPKENGLKVEIVESGRKLTNLFEAIQEIIQQNIIQQKSSFLFVPIDAVMFIRNLSEFLEMHIQRTLTIKKYAATLLCTSVQSILEDTLHNALLGEINKQEREKDSSSLKGDSSNLLGLNICSAERGLRAVPEYLANHVTMFTLQKSTSVVQNMVRLEQGDASPEPAAMTFKKNEEISVRTDLIPTGYFFCSSEALSLFTFDARDQYSFFLRLLTNHELLGNVFGIGVATPSMGALQSINTLETYIQTNIDICFRRFFPLTLESSFAGDQSRYAVSQYCQSVYLHERGAEVLSSTCGPCVVVGEQVVVPQNTLIRGTVLGKGVRIGEGSIIIGCVVLDGAVIGRDCSLSHSLIGYNVLVNSKADISNCIIGEGCIVGVAPHDSGGSNSSKNNNSNSNSSDHMSFNKGGVVLRDQAIVKCDASETDEGLLGYTGLGKAMPERYVSSILPTRELFVRDPVPCMESEASDEEEEEEDDDDDADDEEDSEAMALFREKIVELVDQALRQPSVLDQCRLDMKNLCLSLNRNNSELCFVVTEHLLTHVLEEHRHSDDPKAVMEAVCSLFQQWCSPFYVKMATGEEEMQAILEAICTAIRDKNCLLHRRGPKLLEILYSDCDEDLYDSRGYCVVSGESLVEFGERMRSLKGMHESRANNNSNNSDYERKEGMLLVALSCLTYIDNVRAFLEEEEEEEDD